MLVLTDWPRANRYGKESGKPPHRSKNKHRLSECMQADLLEMGDDESSDDGEPAGFDDGIVG